MDEIPAEILIPKQENKYRVTYYSYDIDDIIFDYKVKRQSLFTTNISWKSRNRDDVISIDEKLNLHKLMKNLRSGSTVEKTMK